MGQEFWFWTSQRPRAFSQLITATIKELLTFALPVRGVQMDLSLRHANTCWKNEVTPPNITNLQTSESLNIIFLQMVKVRV